MIRLLSLFSGIGAFEKALDRIGAKYELVNYCEIDKYASASYAAVHGVSEELNLRDVQTIDCDKLKEKGVNLVTWGFPCQDISVAGKMRGFEHNGQKTRSGLFYDALKVIRELQPEVAIAENVKALTGKKFEAEFAAVRGGLSDAGYNNYYAVLNASDYGIPQHRERVFIVSIRKDIDKDKFAFPQKEPLRLRVKDLLEYEVEEKYYIDTDRARELIRKLAEEGKLPGNPVKIALKQIGEIGPHQTDRVYDPDGLSRSLKSTDYTHPVNIAEAKQNGYVESLKIMRLGNLYSDNAGGSWGGNVYDPEGLAPVLQTMEGENRTPIFYNKCKYRIRKLTPKECWWLMGFDDDDFEKARAAGISNTQLYKQAGNSIVVQVLERIFEKLIETQGIGDGNE